MAHKQFKTSKNSRTTVTRGGRRYSLKDLPLVAFTRQCGHMGREYGILMGDLVFCDTCREAKRVVRVSA